MGSVLSVDVPAEPAFLKSIRGFVTPVMERHFDESGVRQLVLAIDEACSNIIKHGQSWLKPRGRISVEVHESKKKIEIHILDFCKERDVEKVKPRDLDDIKPGGLGTHFISEVMDSVEFVPAKKEGRMAMVMTKNVVEKKSDEADD